MVTNFDFLKKIDKNLFDIISDAEKLYRDEYFEQCMTQTRRFGENLCKNVLGARAEGNFDNMLATLKDMATHDEQEREFVEDLYFLKKHGNESAHSARVKKDGIEALECLQRAFEATINYSVFTMKGSSSILELQFDTELLVTGEKTKKTLKEKYQEERAKSNRTGGGAKPKTSTKQSYTMSTKKNKPKFPLFKVFVCASSVVSVALIIAILVAVKFF